MSLRGVPATLERANSFVAHVHRHMGPVQKPLFSVGVADGATVHGVAVCGRPVARSLDDGLTAEVLRVATDGTRNACSFLYGASWRAAKAIGYTRMVTYTQGEEAGRSVAAAGWLPEPAAGGGRGWGNRPGRTAVRRATTRWVTQCADRGSVPEWPTYEDDAPTLDFGA